MKVAVVAFEGFDELEAVVPCSLVNRLATEGWRAELVAPTPSVASMNGLRLCDVQPLEAANEADVVLFAGGLLMRAAVEDTRLLGRLRLDPLRQWIGGVSGGVLAMARLGLLGSRPACTDAVTRPWLIEAGVLVDDENAFAAHGPVATAGGPHAAFDLTAWVMTRGAGEAAAAAALQLVAPSNERQAFADSILARVRPFLAAPAA